MVYSFHQLAVYFTVVSRSLCIEGVTFGRLKAYLTFSIGKGGVRETRISILDDMQPWVTPNYDADSGGRMHKAA